jgi:hypothetical protein
MVNDTIVKMSLLTSSAIDTINLAALMNTNSNAFAIINFSVILINFLIIFFVFYHHILAPNEECEANGCVFEDTLLETMSDVLSNVLIPCSAFQELVE